MWRRYLLRWTDEELTTAIFMRIESVSIHDIIFIVHKEDEYILGRFLFLLPNRVEVFPESFRTIVVALHTV